MGIGSLEMPDGYAPQTPQQPPPMPPAPGGNPMPESDIEPGKLFAILSYFCFLFIIPLVQKNNRFALYHAWQALVMTIISIVIWVPLTILSFIPIIGCFVSIGSLFIGLGWFILWVIGLINAITGKYKGIPLISKFGEQQFMKM
jgi:uncharacterized membrane protein